GQQHPHLPAPRRGRGGAFTHRGRGLHATTIGPFARAVQVVPFLVLASVAVTGPPTTAPFARPWWRELDSVGRVPAGPPGPGAAGGRGVARRRGPAAHAGPAAGGARRPRRGERRLLH